MDQAADFAGRLGDVDQQHVPSFKACYLMIDKDVPCEQMNRIMEASPPSVRSDISMMQRAVISKDYTSECPLDYGSTRGLGERPEGPNDRFPTKTAPK